jgi:hypothetical protein
MSLEPTHQQRFDRQLYLHYVDINEYNNFKHVSKEEFNRLTEKHLQGKRTIEFDKNRIYRLADEKEICYGKYNRVIGEIWKEDGIESYWIYQPNIK